MPADVCGDQPDTRVAHKGLQAHGAGIERPVSFRCTDFAPLVLGVECLCRCLRLRESGHGRDRGCEEWPRSRWPHGRAGDLRRTNVNAEKVRGRHGPGLRPPRHRLQSICAAEGGAHRHARTWANERELSAPVFDLQSLPGEGALEEAGLRVDEMQSLSVMPCVVWRSMEMWGARNRRARHHDDVPLALVVVSGYLFMGEPSWHVALPVMRTRGQAWR
jgi:hypothetical protein